MKKIIKAFLLMALMLPVVSCEKEEEPDFNYPKEAVYGTWDATDVNFGDGWIDVTQSWIDFELSLTLYEDGTFCGRGEFGNGCGTYTMYGNTIQTYINDKEYLKYEVVNLTAGEFIVYDRSGDSMKIKAKRRT